ncbi:MAG: hypothetical protein IPI66_10225 [Chitinophagaceae bacterium]|nr:hypothetical protein [Chitinophagaceae bacterium]
MYIRVFFLFLSACFGLALFSCTGSRMNYSPEKKYSRAQLQEDYSILRNILEKKHPSPYWYTPKDSLDYYFDKYYRSIGDSMTEQQFGWKILAPLTNKIRCGHTSFGMSRAYNRWAANRRFASFPLGMKVWNDTMVVTSNLNRKDSLLKRGTMITGINGVRNKEMIQTLFGYLTEDGYADNINYIRLSSNFPYYHRNVFGLSKKYTVNYLDSLGKERTTVVPLFEFPKDTTKRIRPAQPPVTKTKKETRQQRLQSIRSMAVDTIANTAVITLNTFTTGGLRRFFRQSFRYVRKAGITHVVLDLRSNGGGKINLSTLLTRYVSRKPFKVADTAFAVAKTLGPYSRYIKNRFINNLGLLFLTRKQDDGLYHFGHWERKYYQPRKANHYEGELYILTNGQTFSASTLFCNAVKGQPGITLVGEEAGGGWHGNNGILIPDITCPIPVSG